MDTERVESILFLCRKALKSLHPVMNKDEPCIAYEAYRKAGDLLIELEEASQPEDSADMIWPHDGEFCPDCGRQMNHDASCKYYG